MKNPSLWIYGSLDLIISQWLQGEDAERPRGHRQFHRGIAPRGALRPALGVLQQGVDPVGSSPPLGEVGKMA